MFKIVTNMTQMFSFKDICHGASLCLQFLDSTFCLIFTNNYIGVFFFLMMWLLSSEVDQWSYFLYLNIVEIGLTGLIEFIAKKSTVPWYFLCWHWFLYLIFEKAFLGHPCKHPYTGHKVKFQRWNVLYIWWLTVSMSLFIAVYHKVWC